MQVAQGTQNNIRAWCHAAVTVHVSSGGNPCRVSAVGIIIGIGSQSVYLCAHED